MSEVIKIVTIFQLNDDEKRKLTERCPKVNNTAPIHRETTITKTEFLGKLKSCFEQFYSDMYLSTYVAFVDDPNMKTEWFITALSEAKKYYASVLQKSEHVFFTQRK